MTKLAHDIVIDHEVGTLTIDGEQFAWFIPLADVDVTIGKDDMNTIMLPIYFDGNFRSWGKAPE